MNYRYLQISEKSETTTGEVKTRINITYLNEQEYGKTCYKLENSLSPTQEITELVSKEQKPCFGWVDSGV